MGGIGSLYSNPSLDIGNFQKERLNYGRKIFWQFFKGLPNIN